MAKPILANKKICFVGAGAMAEAILRGVIDKGIAHADHVFVVNRHNQNRLQELRRTYGVQIHSDKKVQERFIADADIVLLAMKPKDVEEALGQIKASVHKPQLIISVIAGLSIQSMLQYLESDLAIARTMPNTSSTIGLGATGISFSAQVTEDQRSMTMAIFEAIGIAEVVEEPLLEVVTGVSGSGPAYVYYFIEQLVEAAVEGGLSLETAKKLAVQTVLGAASMVQETGEEPAVLRKKVTSPNGTTQAALEKMDELGFPNAVKQAVHRSSERARELGALMEIRPKEKG
ncbi:pyrroline-5-carboxylate reductase [Marinicrinis lubricantis]|uniref:Pyrroline-5-carboxylate reductase n=1 Tax=Marinicrinis lubricantis TaxID=2086470 RepID=A0ABW1ILV3_9BACL